MAAIDLDHATLDRDGFAVHRGLFDAAEMARVIELVEAADAVNPHHDQLNDGAMRSPATCCPAVPTCRRGPLAYSPLATAASPGRVSLTRADVYGLVEASRGHEMP